MLKKIPLCQSFLLLPVLMTLLLVVTCTSKHVPSPEIFSAQTPVCEENNCPGRLPYPTETQPPPDINWTIALEGDGIQEPIVYTYQDLIQIMQVGVNSIPSAIPGWVNMPDDKTDWAGWAGVYVDHLLPDTIRYSRSISITTIQFFTDDGQNVEVLNPWHGNTPIITLKNGSGEWLAEIVDSPGPVRLIVVGGPPDLWIYRVSRIIIKCDHN